jgi:DNA-binding MarR family transcriptional regulator
MDKPTPKDRTAARQRDDEGRQAAERLVVLLGDLMEAMVAVDSKPMDFDTGTVLHRAELHAIQAIGREPGLSLTRLAEVSGVTKGAASQVVSRLVGKGMVSKEASTREPRMISLELTELGWTAHAAHERLHDGMIAAVRAHYGADMDARVAVVTPVVEELIGLVATYGRLQVD